MIIDYKIINFHKYIDLQKTFYKKKGLKQGISIIEIIIYLALFTTISIVVINSFIIVISTFSTIRANHDLINAGSNSMERISREIRQAKNIDIVNSTFDSNSSILRLNDTNGTSYVVFDKSGNGLRISKNGVTIGNLLTDNVILNKLIFTRISTPNSEGVKIEIEVEDINDKTERIEKFCNTVILRGGYQN
ncbi:MAG: hypothetical protein UR85_C0009G0013 [Candidatus Nomurabacteria bacterium GW2011_GWF2_35_66]|uniref:Prepilin-type N-terminal cleavage/methylation domain-containing protein n=1 Tax=Candidatus Nomurabacteria bacterium GW2011_GWE1_35_16 TaxID=1618761 RepID=A0A0G0DSW7_9BACT|nr:MAG: hypothetical protein UR55_C0014G0013 [Candidatus Nomurabacteria bacterium GW2011_GWF1_34_20]KKP62104.1 MAG: hypothetical protein UR57_C0013G0029 [Candidatus Nomurabacteria bacterium GW2011_GWE2_34_25]KKP66070.1 MAG: hypothetical protein UR64_C0013G0029 [Candidatus Nomurabacteria bacterium GW2011_GWE1_35_16]KKP83024.1 MAG: hypothetical protein UR85_C0009G0013 [Candidatus Nomurabacteria bacterium GW2011_GWF2_35_66]HAE36979.1 hypothetical protein [Candidatus Nomurabacteria bacterium]